METKEEVEAVRGLVKPVPYDDPNQESVELPSDPTDYEDNDEAEPLSPSGTYEMDATPSEEQAVEAGEPEKDAEYWRQAAVAAQSEAAALRRAQEEEKERAFQRQLESLPEDERAKVEVTYWREKAQAVKLERAQERLAHDAPITTGSWAIMSRAFDMQIDDPDMFEPRFKDLEPEFDKFVNGIVEQRLAERISEMEKGVNKAWGVPGGLHNAKPKASDVDPALRSYKQAQEQLKQSTPTVDSVRQLLDARRRLTQGR
jgi:hypothetical protein